MMMNATAGPGRPAFGVHATLLLPGQGGRTAPLIARWSAYSMMWGVPGRPHPSNATAATLLCQSAAELEPGASTRLVLAPGDPADWSDVAVGDVLYGYEDGRLVSVAQVLVVGELDHWPVMSSGSAAAWAAWSHLGVNPSSALEAFDGFESDGSYRLTIASDGWRLRPRLITGDDGDPEWTVDVWLGQQRVVATYTHAPDPVLAALAGWRRYLVEEAKREDGAEGSFLDQGWAYLEGLSSAARVNDAARLNPPEPWESLEDDSKLVRRNLLRDDLVNEIGAAHPLSGVRMMPVADRPGQGEAVLVHLEDGRWAVVELGQGRTGSAQIYSTALELAAAISLAGR